MPTTLTRSDETMAASPAPAHPTLHQVPPAQGDAQSHGHASHAHAAEAAHAHGSRDQAHGAQPRAGPSVPKTAATLGGPRAATWTGFRRIATVMEGDPVRAAARVAKAGENADLVEVRLDAFWPSAPEADAATDLLIALRAATTRPLLATLRPRRQGGRFEGAEGARLGLLAAARLSGFDAIDVEDDHENLAGLLTALRQGGTPVVLSRHWNGPTPCRDDGMTALLRMMDHGGALHKFAFESGSYPDLMRAVELTHAHAKRGGRPCVTPIGFGGAESRALLALAGNRAAYGHDGIAAIPGQPALADIDAVLAHWGIRPADLDRIATENPGWLAVFGHPVAHSLSPRIHNAALRSVGEAPRMGALDIPASPGALRLTLGLLQRLGILGASITSPHKVEAAKLAECDEVAAAVGAVNCITVRGDKVVGTNTDATALRRLMAPNAQDRPTAVVLGAGGAARAAVWALRSLGARVTIAARDPAKATAAFPGCKVVPWQERSVLRADLWVQTTPLGRTPGDEAAADARMMRGTRQAVELVYGNVPTAFEQAATAAGIRTVSGRDVLVLQAALAYQFWFGRDAPLEAMRRAGAIAG